MTQRSFNGLAGAIFGLVALLHALRLLFGWEAVIGGWAIPRWFSVLGLLVAGPLSYAALSLNRAGKR